MAKAKQTFRKRTRKLTPRRVPAPTVQEDSYIHYGVAKISGKFVVERIGDPGVDEGYDASADKFQLNYNNSEYVNLFRMYPNGKVNPVFEIKSKTEDDDNDPRLVAFNAAQREAQALVEAAYDREFPEIATKVQDFISNSVSNILSLNIPREADRAFDDESLLNITQQQEKEFLTMGSITPQLGWELAPGKAFLMPIALPAEGKYRYARAVSEIAQVVNARAIIHIGETWDRDVKTGERNGQEGLLAVRVLPDASVVSRASGTYVRVNGRLQVVESAHVLNGELRMTQHLFPAWKIAGTVQAQASAAVN